MFFNFLTFLAAFSVAAVAEWFSVVGIISIYAGAPFHAGLILGIVLGFAKLVNTSWLYRNWENASLRLKVPLMYFLIALMIMTSMGTFGFLTKSHLEQGAATIDNTAKVERLDQQIAREQSTIDDDQKVIVQLDSAINSYIGKDRTDKAVSVRRSQNPQRKQLRDDIDASQKRIDEFSDDKLKLTSQDRSLQLEVGPIRYIAELFLGTGGDNSSKIETAVKWFTLLIVSTLDPLAIILLIAANHTLLRRNEKNLIENIQETTPDITGNRVCAIDKIETEQEETTIADTKLSQESNTIQTNTCTVIYEPAIPECSPSVDGAILPSSIKHTTVNEEENINTAPANILDPVLEGMGSGPTTTAEEAIDTVQISEIYDASAGCDRLQIPLPEEASEELNEETSIAWTQIVQDNQVVDGTENFPAPPCAPSVVSEVVGQGDHCITELPTGVVAVSMNEELIHKPLPTTISTNNSVLREILGTQLHFIPQKIIESKVSKPESDISNFDPGNNVLDQNITRTSPINTKYPVSLSWLKEFKGK